MTPEQEQQIRVLWEETPRTILEISRITGLSVGTISGKVRRRKWKSFNPPITKVHYARGGTANADRGHTLLSWPYERTIFGRLDALNAKLDRVLAETEPAIRSGRAADATTLRAGERGGPVVG